jgi:DNA-binding cell septation regulator SpoVG
MPVRVDVLEIRPIEGKGNLKAFVSVEIAKKFKIHSCRVVQQPGQAPWVSTPQESYTAKDGSTKYKPLVELADDIKADVSAAVLNAYREKLGENQGRGFDNQDQGDGW